MNNELYNKVVYNISTKILLLNEEELRDYLKQLQSFLGISTSEFEVYLCHALNIATVNTINRCINKGIEMSNLEITKTLAQKVNNVYYSESYGK